MDFSKNARGLHYAEFLLINYDPRHTNQKCFLKKKGLK